MKAERRSCADAMRRRLSAAAVLTAAMLLAFGCAGRGGPDLFGGDPRGSSSAGSPIPSRHAVCSPICWRAGPPIRGSLPWRRPSSARLSPPAGGP